MRLPGAETRLSYSQVPPVQRGARDIASAVARARHVAHGAPWMHAEVCQRGLAQTHVCKSLGCAAIN
eukprot:4783263-Pyramimonas_sp.AAC.1